MAKEYELLKEEGNTIAESMDRLVNIVNILRKECPWDREQTHETLVTPMIEEAYEAVDAIERKDWDNLREELGDVLLQVVFHGMLGEESKEFTTVDIINDECEKMIRRHPHVFEEEISKEKSKSVDKILKNWDNIKGKEHVTKTYHETLENVPKSFPALIRSEKVQKKAASIGFDWDSVQGAFEKVGEEATELLAAYQSGIKADMEEELGDLLFSVVNVGRFLHVNSEDALRRSTEKFIKRFEIMEQLSKIIDKDMKNMSIDELDELWRKAKEIN